MELELFVVDAFTTERFKGNSAAVVPVTHWLSDAQMLAIAQENNLSETAFIKRLAANHYAIRWFSPLTEIDFCGHATLASAYVLFNHFACDAPLNFETAAVGTLSVTQTADKRITMRFPNRAPGRVMISVHRKRFAFWWPISMSFPPTSARPAWSVFNWILRPWRIFNLSINSSARRWTPPLKR